MNGFANWVCPACGYRHLGHPSVRACTGIWIGRLFGDCPPKEKGLHFHVGCIMCKIVAIIVAKETK